MYSTQSLAIPCLHASIGHPQITIALSQKEAPLLFFITFELHPSTVFKTIFLIYLPTTLLRQLEVEHNIPSTNPQNQRNASSGHHFTYDTVSSPSTATNTSHGVLWVVEPSSESLNCALFDVQTFIRLGFFSPSLLQLVQE